MWTLPTVNCDYGFLQSTCDLYNVVQYNRILSTDEYPDTHLRSHPSGASKGTFVGSTVQCRYNMADFLQIPHHGHNQLACGGQILGCHLWVPYLVYVLLSGLHCCTKCCVAFIPLQWYQTLDGREMTAKHGKFTGCQELRYTCIQIKDAKSYTDHLWTNEKSLWQ